ncbi:MAG TPA: hypothetical protein VHD32_07030 [Candidatus Didemnitutus sp.]|nr:hypothetical protein [Candidatus Didemnitutus sp.]
MSYFSKNPTHSPFSGAAAPAVIENEGAITPFRDASEHWYELATEQRGARLFRVEPVATGPVYWIAEVTTADRIHHRRCASELYARWWLNAFLEPVRSPDPILGAQLEDPLRDHSGN